jgi:hypothetical protein
MSSRYTSVPTVLQLLLLPQLQAIRGQLPFRGRYCPARGALVLGSIRLSQQSSVRRRLLQRGVLFGQASPSTSTNAATRLPGTCWGQLCAPLSLLHFHASLCTHIRGSFWPLVTLELATLCRVACQTCASHISRLQGTKAPRLPLSPSPSMGNDSTSAILPELELTPPSSSQSAPNTNITPGRRGSRTELHSQIPQISFSRKHRLPPEAEPSSLFPSKSTPPLENRTPASILVDNERADSLTILTGLMYAAHALRSHLGIQFEVSARAACSTRSTAYAIIMQPGQ